MNAANLTCYWLPAEYLRSLVVGNIPQWIIDWTWLFLALFVLVNSIGVYRVIRFYHPMTSGFVGAFVCFIAIYFFWILIPFWLGVVLISWVSLVDIAFPSAVIVD